MIYRFRILEPISTGAPDYNICGQATSVIDYNGLTISLDLDGENILTASNLQTAMTAFPLSGTTTANGINWTIRQENTDWVAIDIGLPNVWDSTELEIVHTKANYWNYKSVIPVYGYDLGVNSNVPASTANPDMDIVLISKTNNQNAYGDITKMFTKFVGYRKPFSDRINLVGLASNGSALSGLQSTITNSNGDVVGRVDNISVCNEAAETYSLSRTAPYVSTACLASIAIDGRPNDIMTYDTSITCPTCGCTDCNDCIDLNSPLEAIVNFDNQVERYRVNDTQIIPYTDFTLTYELYDIYGTKVLDDTRTINISYPVTVAPSATLWNIGGLPVVGDYLVKTIVEKAGVFTCTEDTIITGCDLADVKYTETCGDISIKNLRTSDLEVDIQILNADGETFTSVLTSTIAGADTATYTLPRTGVYKVVLTNGNDTHFRIVVNWCSLGACLLKYVQALMCGEVKCKCQGGTSPCGCGCSDVAAATHDFNAVMAMTLSYFSIMNLDYKPADIFTALSDTDLAKLYDIQQLLERAETYCAECKFDDCGCS